VTGVLRVYDPPECGDDGRPLDWEWCRACAGTGSARAREYGRIDSEDGPIFLTPPGGFAALAEPCGTCQGHGSLKAAALAALVVNHACGNCGHVTDHMAGGGCITRGCGCRHKTPSPPDPRCSGCGHPMSEGTWERDGLSHFDPNRVIVSALAALRRCHEPYADWQPGSPGAHVHYSPCDEGCRHGGPIRVYEASVEAWVDQPHGFVPVQTYSNHERVEASWRQVDVRAHGWDHDLRLEKLALLCLRCEAERW
jgi:hypothetical protein